MNIILLGMNHKTAPLELRERLALACGDGAAPLKDLAALPAVREVLFLTTCNRIEIVASTDGSAAAGELRNYICGCGEITNKQLASALYLYSDEDAVRHLFRVASSLDSMVMGEPQILGQVKEAYSRCVAHKASGVMLNKLMHAAFRTAKRVRTETGIAGNAVSVSFAAVELAKKIFSELAGKTVLLVGAGEMSELAAKHFIGNGVDRLIIANRTFERALKLADELHGTAIGFDRLEEKLLETDILLSSTGASGFIITREMMARALRRRRNRLIFIIDIAVPRDVDPAVGAIDNVFLYNIDNLQEIVDANVRTRMQEALKAEEIIDEEVKRFSDWCNSLEAVPTIVSLREKIEGIVKQEMEKSGSWINTLSGEDRKNLELLVSSILNKVLHDPISGLKEESIRNGAMPYIAVLRKLFKLEE